MFPRTARVLGWLSLAVAVVYGVALWVSVVGPVWWPEALPVVWAGMLAGHLAVPLVAVLVFTLVAQGCGNWQDRPSGFAVLVLYGGGLLLFVVSLGFMLARGVLDILPHWLGW